MLTALELGQSLNHQGRGGRQMPNHELPQRDPFIGPPTTYASATADVVELFADALREWSTTEPTCADQRDQGV